MDSSTSRADASDAAAAAALPAAAVADPAAALALDAALEAEPAAPVALWAAADALPGDRVAGRCPLLRGGGAGDGAVPAAVSGGRALVIRPRPPHHRDGTGYLDGKGK